MPSTQERRVGGMAALVAGGVVAGGILAGTLTASADDSTTSPSATPAAEGLPGNPNPGDPSQPQRSDEELLTGSTAQKVRDAVLAKYPGATFVRVETDSDGVYEAHITKADGTPLTVELDKGFAIIGEEQMGAGRGGPGHGPDGDGDGPDSGGPGAGAGAGAGASSST
jgi:hypothetical protein